MFGFHAAPNGANYKQPLLFDIYKHAAPLGLKDAVALNSSMSHTHTHTLTPTLGVQSKW